MTSTTRRLALAITASALLSLGALSGCSADDISEKVGEELVENQLGDGADVDVDTDSGEVSIKDGDGNSYEAGGDLPDDFPDEVPLIEGTVLSAVSVTDQGRGGWSVALTVDGSGDDAYAEAGAELESAGFTKDTEITSGSTTGAWSKDTFEVLVSAFDNGDGNATVSYTVSER